MDIWTPDQTRAIADVENELSAKLSSFLYGVHLDAHRALGLGGVNRFTVQQAYPNLPLTVSKAEGDSRAARLFEELINQPRQARKARDLADALTAHWTERGLITDAATQAVTRANIQGRIEAARSQPRPPRDSDAPSDAAYLWGVERAAEHAVRLADTTRALLATSITDALLRGDSPQTLAGTLVNKFGTLNRDARRLAITEVAFARANGFLSALPAGERVEWFTAAACCPACGKLNGRTFTVVKQAGDPDTQVWPGKHRVGIKENDACPAIPYHPNCRCRWLRANEAPTGVSERLTRALAELVD